MNCSQARAMMAAYRELENREVETIGLDIHLESCEFLPERACAPNVRWQTASRFTSS